MESIDERRWNSTVSHISVNRDFEMQKKMIFLEEVEILYRFSFPVTI